eukprot:2538607-Prymnesium_polylepis.1
MPPDHEKRKDVQQGMPLEAAAHVALSRRSRRTDTSVHGACNGRVSLACAHEERYLAADGSRGAEGMREATALAPPKVHDDAAPLRMCKLPATA